MSRCAFAGFNSFLLLAVVFSSYVNAAKNDPAWSDTVGWADLTNYTTIQSVGTRDDLFLLARGNSGMTTLRFDHANESWEEIATNDPKWSDAAGWSDISNYSTIQAVAVGDELYLLARSNSGMITLRYDATIDAWQYVASNDPRWSDAIDWKESAYYSTIQAVSVADDLYLLARSSVGMTTLRYNRSIDRWDDVASNDPKWSDAAGWSDEANYSTIQAVSTGDNLYLLARANSGMITLRYNRVIDRWDNAAINDPKWSDDDAWSDLSNYSTIQAIGTDDQLYLLARSNSGVTTLALDQVAGQWNAIASNDPRWSDTAGWDDFTNYSTIQSVAVGNDLHLLARANSGMITLRFDPATDRWESIASNDPIWSDSVGWNEFSNYSTIQAVSAAGKLFLLARDNGGMSTRSFDSATKQWVGTARIKNRQLSNLKQAD